MPELIKMNGSAVNALSCYRRDVAQPDGSALDEFQIAVMVRGRMTHRSFASLLESGTIRIEHGSAEARETTVTAASVTSTGGGESAVYRHDFTLRETAASAARRQAAAEHENARLAAAVAELNVMVADVDDRAADPSGDTWASALQKLESSSNGSSPRIGAPGSAAATGPAERQPPPPSPDLHHPAPSEDVSPAVAPRTRPVQAAADRSVPPDASMHLVAPRPALDPAPATAASVLSPTEVAGVEAVLVGLRLEALIDALDRMEIVPRDDVEQAFVRLVQKRFVAEASLVVGEPVARRAARDILHGLGVGRWALGVGGDR